MNTPLIPASSIPPELEPEASPGVVALLTWLGEGKRTIAAVTVIAIAASVAYALSLPNQYTARTTLLPPNSSQQSGSSAALSALGSLGGLAGSISAKTPDELYVQLLRSDTVQRALDKRFDLRKRYRASNHEDLRGALPTYIRVASDKKSGVISVEVDDLEPQFAADLANAHATEITRLLSRLAVSEAQQRRVFFEAQLKETKDNLVAAEQALRVVQEKSGMVVLDKQADAIITAVAQLKTRIAEREIQLRVLRTSTTAENPDVRLLTSELSALRGELARMESSGASAVGGAEARNNGSIDIPVGKLPSAAVDFIRASREVKFQETMLSSMLRQFEVAKLDEAKDAPALQQVDVATPPDRKSKPTRWRIVVGATLLAFLGASFWVLWRGFSRTVRVRDPESARALGELRAAWRLRRKVD